MCVLLIYNVRTLYDCRYDKWNTLVRSEHAWIINMDYRSWLTRSTFWQLFVLVDDNRFFHEFCKGDVREHNLRGYFVHRDFDYLGDVLASKLVCQCRPKSVFIVLTDQRESVSPPINLLLLSLFSRILFFSKGTIGFSEHHHSIEIYFKNDFSLVIV
jgi:hypothetical protein